MDKKHLKYFLVLSIIFFLSCSKEKKPMHQQIILKDHWQFWQQDNQEKRYPAEIPGSIHLDLLANQLIPEPYLSNNEKTVRWVENENWTYETHFTIDQSLLYNEIIQIIFKGLDTYSQVYLNNQEILSTDNMFLEYRVNIKEFLETENTLRIEFTSAIKQAEPLYDSHIKLPADNDRNTKATSVYTRKAPYQYGWDWGPRLVGVGIWQPIYLEFWNKIKIQNSRIYQKELLQEKAVVAVELNIFSKQKQNVLVEVYQDSISIFQQEISLVNGENHIHKTLEIKQPKLWWPNGSGDVHLYHFQLKVQHQNKKWEKGFKLGFRTIKLQQKEDSIGESFTFIVNGEPIYIKGANYIPQDAFPSKVTEESYQKILHLAKDANMNMLRVWGGGYYEMEEFYEICDELGILVWQDFMFSCSLYPGDSAFLSNVNQEATYQIKRLRDHASLALWCGNNEMNELWHNWGYQKAYGYSKTDSIQVWHDYLAIFDTILPQLVQQYNTQTSYLESSPIIGWGHDESMTNGDSHYWGIWWGKQPFEMYENKVPRFSSEFGFQSLPHLNTILSFTDSSQLDLFSVDMKAHQKSSIGNKTILEYLPNYFPEPSNFKELIYVSQLLQAYGMSLAFQAQRLAKPYCMGTLYWQLNDCWPGLSWSSIDYYGQKKATHYIAEKDFSNFLVKVKMENKRLQVAIVSDSLQGIQANLTTAIISFSGDTIQLTNTEILLSANQKITLDIPLEDIWQFNPVRTFIYTKLSTNNQILAKSIDFFGKPIDLNLPFTNLKIDSIADNKFLVYSSTPVFNYSVYLSTQEFGNFEPNFFHLLPGDSVVVEFIPNKMGMVIPVENIDVVSLNNIY